MEKICLTVTEAAVVTGLGRSTFYKALSSGLLPARKIGKRTIILQSDLIKYLENLDVYKAGK